MQPAQADQTVQPNLLQPQVLSQLPSTLKIPAHLPLLLRDSDVDSSRANYVKGATVVVEEDKEHEFKSGTTVPDTVGYIQTIAVKYMNAFLNASGGTIYFGIEDDGIVSGLLLDRGARDDLRLRLDAGVTNFRPEVDPDMWEVQFVPVRPAPEANFIPNTFVVEIAVQKGRAPIYFTNEKGKVQTCNCYKFTSKNAKAYVRRTGSISEMSRNTIEERKAMGRATYNVTITNRANTLVGREHEVEMIRDFITQNILSSEFDVAYCVGKTSVAQHVALQLRNTFPEFHVHINMQGKDTKFIELHEAMSGVIRTILPMAPVPTTDVEIAGLYQENVGKAAQVVSLLPSDAAACLVIITSYKTLGLDAVVELYPCLELRLGALMPVDAIKLLKSLVPYDLEQEHAERLVQLCCNMPSPIRLVASRLNRASEMKPDELIRRLSEVENQSELLTPFFDTAVISEEIARYVLPLAVFPGSFDSSAAVAIYAEDYDRTHSILQKLTDFSLLEYDPIKMRYYQCDIIRSRAVVRAKQKPDEFKVWVERFVIHFVQVLTHIKDTMATAKQDALALLSIEEGNIEACLKYAKKYHKDEEAALITGTMSRSDIVSTLAAHIQQKWKEIFDPTHAQLRVSRQDKPDTSVHSNPHPSAALPAQTKSNGKRKRTKSDPPLPDNLHASAPLPDLTAHASLNSLSQSCQATTKKHSRSPSKNKSHGQPADPPGSVPPSPANVDSSPLPTPQPVAKKVSISIAAVEISPPPETCSSATIMEPKPEVAKVILPEVVLKVEPKSDVLGAPETKVEEQSSIKENKQTAVGTDKPAINSPTHLVAKEQTLQGAPSVSQPTGTPAEKAV